MSRYALITQREQINAAQRLLVKRLASEAGQLRTSPVGFPSGDMKARVRYLAAYGFWHAVPRKGERLHNRHWNGFGFDDPAESRALTLTVEINPSFTGSRKCAGLFVRDARDRLYLGHTGRIGGGREGVGKLEFLPEVKDLLVSIDEREGLLIGRIEAKNFTRELADFVRAVRKFKSKVANSAR
jgi:hypothetical protein